MCAFETNIIFYPIL